MSSFVSRWVVLQRHTVGAADLDADGVVRDDVTEHWIADARHAYLELCEVLRETVEGSQLVLTFGPAIRDGAQSGRPTAVTVSAGTTEVFPTSFTMAFRLRGYGETEFTTVNATCAVTLEDPASGEECEITAAIRDELIALEHAARHTN